MTSKQGPLGTASYTYDELNRVLTKNYSDTSTVRAVYAYDGYSSPFGASTQGPPAVGHLTGSWSVNHDGTVVAAEEFYNFDAMGRAQAGRQCTPGTCGLTNYPLTMAYNYLSNETVFSDPAQTRTTGYDTTDRLRSFGATLPSMGNQNLVTVPANGYGPLGLLTATLGNGLTEARGYNLQRTWLNSVQVGSVYSFSIPTFDGNGSVLTANDSTNGNWTYGYDSLNRLQTAVGTPPQGNQNFTYYPDQYGNMYCSNSVLGGLPCTPKHGPQLNLHMNFNSKNQIWDDGDNVYQYDAGGNLLQDGTHGYVYDLENRITCVGVDINGNCTTTSTYYFYDAAGQRVGKQQFNNLEDYVYDLQGHITSVYANGSTSAFRAELYTPQGRHVSTWNPGANNGPLFYNFADWLGTERVRTNVINGTVTVAESCTDTPYGMNLACATFPGLADTSPMHFTGKQRDYESNLDYFGARYFGSNMGRWLSPDWSEAPEPVPYADFTNPQSLNLYAYVRNNPVTDVDAYGHVDGAELLAEVKEDVDLLSIEANEVADEVGAAMGGGTSVAGSAHWGLLAGPAIILGAMIHPAKVGQSEADEIAEKNRLDLKNQKQQQQQQQQQPQGQTGSAPESSAEHKKGARKSTHDDHTKRDPGTSPPPNYVPHRKHQQPKGDKKKDGPKPPYHRKDRD